MTYYDSSNVYRKIMSLEDKVNGLEEILEYTRGGGYVSSPSYYEGGVGDKPSHYKSAVRLSRATQNFKQDLLQNPHHSRLSRESYRQIYKRVSVLEKELNNIIKNMDLQRNQRSDYNYYSNNARSESFYDVSPYMNGCDSHSNKRIVNRPRRKRITYDSYIELIPDDSSSSESIEEIIYYVEPSSSSSSSTLIVEEYIPKSYTRRSVRRAPIFDVSKSKQEPREEKPPPKTRIKHHRRNQKYPPPEISVSQVRKSKKGNKKIRVEKSESEASEPGEKSEIFLVKRSKESPKDIKKEKSKGKTEKYFVSRLKRVEPKDNTKNNLVKNKKRNTTEKSSPAGIKYSKYDEEPLKNRENTKQVKSDANETKVVQQSINYKQKKVETGPSPSKQSTETITVAHSSLILNDPFVRTINYDDLDSHGEENNITFSSSNIKVTQNKRSESELGAAMTSIYNTSNSIYTFDPFLKQKEKLYTKEKMNNFSLTQCSKNKSHKNHKSVIHNAKESDIIVNNSKQKHRQKQFTFKQTKNDKNLNYLNNAKDKTGNGTIRALSPIAHSVFLTTVPVYPDLQYPSHPQISSPIRSQSSCNNYKKPVRPNSNISKQQRTVVEDAILMDVARKLSPVVAKIINAHYSKSKENLKPQSDSSMSASYNNLCIAQSKINQDSSLIIKDQISKDRNKLFNNTKYNELKLITDSTNPTSIFRGPLDNLIYISKIEDVSPLDQKKPSKIKRVLKKSKTLASVSNLLKKSNPEESSKYLTEKQSKDSIQMRESIITQQHDSTMIKKPRSSQISQTPKQALKVGHNPKTSTSLLKSNSKRGVDEFEILEPLPKSLSNSGVQNFEPKKSVSNKSKKQSSNKKSISRFKRVLNKMTSGEKFPEAGKKKAEPTLISILSKTRDRNSKLLKKAQNLENIESLEKESHQTDLEQKQGSISRIENLSQNLNQQKRTHSPEQYIEDEPALLVEVYDGKSENLQQSQNQAAQKQSKIDIRKDSIGHDLTPQSRLIRNISPKSYTQGFDNKVSEQLKRLSRLESVIGGDKPLDNPVDNPDAVFNNSGSIRASEKSEREVLHGGSRRYINKIRSVSQYYEEPNLNLLQNSEVERHKSLPSQVRISTPIDTTNNNNLVAQERSKVMEQALNGLEGSTFLKTNETPRNSQELLYMSPYNKKPLQFCVHFSKEKRTKYESPSTLSLDHFLSSQCKKIYSSEDISLSEYAFDENTDTYRYRKICPKEGKKSFKGNINLPSFLKKPDSNGYFNNFMKDVQSNSKCCCKTTRSIQLISEGSYLDWHEVANEIKQAI